MRLSCICPISEHFVSLLKRAGYRGIEPFAKDQFNPEKNSFGGMKRLKSLAEDSGLEIAALCGLFPPDIKLLSPDPAMRKRGEQYFRNLIKIGRDLDIKTLAFGSGTSRSLPENVSYSEGYKWLVNLLQICGGLAGANNMRIVVETQSRGESNMIMNMRELINFISNVNSPYVGITADLHHMNEGDPDIPRALEEADGLVWHVHLSDTDRLAPGDGTLDFPKIITKLRKLNYHNYLSLEIKSSLIVERTLLKVNKFIRRILQ